MTFGSICSGIEAASVAWEPLGWRCAFVAEIDPFPSAVLAHRYPEVPNFGDFTRIGPDAGPVDVLVGGTPCQSFSVAGLRRGLADDRGNLALGFLRLAGRLCPRWLVWENVPGVLSSNGGRDFGAFLGGMVELGYGFAYRVLDAQYFGVPQRRRRVFVVGHLGDWRRAAAVLFERHSLSGNPPPRREAGAGSTPSIAPCLRARSQSSHRADSEAYVTARALTTSGGTRCDLDTETFVACTLPASDGGASSGYHPVVPVAFNWSQSGDTNLGMSLPGVPPVRQKMNPAILRGSAVRRLTPRECERLQGFPDDWTLVPYRGKPAADGPRYKAIGNSMAVLVMAWIGRRIQAADAIPTWED